MNGFDVDTDGLRAHASELRVIGGDLGKAAQAGGITMLQDSAFGILCSFLVPPALAVQTACTAVIGAASGSVDSTAGLIRGVADGYDAIEDAVSTLMSGITDLIPTK
jgi:hypothetical protein